MVRKGRKAASNTRRLTALDAAMNHYLYRETPSHLHDPRKRPCTMKAEPLVDRPKSPNPPPPRGAKKPDHLSLHLTPAEEYMLQVSLPRNHTVTDYAAAKLGALVMKHPEIPSSAKGIVRDHLISLLNKGYIRGPFSDFVAAIAGDIDEFVKPPPQSIVMAHNYTQNRIQRATEALNPSSSDTPEIRRNIPAEVLVANRRNP